jgi:hypothetical protein
MVRPAFMPHCFAAALQAKNDFEFQIVPGAGRRILPVSHKLRAFSKK